MSPGRDCTAFLQWALPSLQRSWPGYRRVRHLLCKRLAQRLKALGLADLEAYRRQLATRPDEWRVLDALCAIPVSRFYRDRGVYGALERRVLPALVETAAHPALAAWSAGCASGEEPYSLALVWALRLQPRFPDARLRIVATDSDPEVLARARAGRYARSSLKELPEDLRVQGFEEKEDGAWRIRDRFRAVDFVQQDLREAMPDGPFDLILCRNVVLTYYAAPLRDLLVTRIAARLRPGGALVVGAHESVPPGVRELVAWRGARMIYRKRAAGHSGD